MMSPSFEDRLFPKLQAIIEMFGTPFHIYDEVGIRETARTLQNLFATLKFQEFFAVKALPNPSILAIMHDVGFGFDCSSVSELTLARRVGALPEQIMFTSNNTSHEEFEAAAAEGGSILNLDDITLVDKVSGDFPQCACFRYNPGPRRTGNSIIGIPEEAKYGVAHDQIVEAYRLAVARGASRFGVHTMVCSNELDHHYMVDTVASLLDLIHEINREIGITFDFINMGGGLGIPYRPDECALDLVDMAREIRTLFTDFHQSNAYTPRLFMESGRYVTGPHGVLVAKVINQKHTYREYRGVDACMSSLMRPGMYRAYHHISVLDRCGSRKRGTGVVVDVVGSLCENNDKFAIQRALPPMSEGDLVVVHDTGAHGIAMGFQYNGRVRPQELLLCVDGSVKLIGRAETLEDLFARYTFEEKQLVLR